jgi:hypothetical protein
MRFCGAFQGLQNLTCPENRPQPYCVAGEGVSSSLLPIHHTDRRAHRQTRLAQRRNGLQKSTSGGHNVLDQAHTITFVVNTFDTVGGAVLLRSFPHDQKRQARSERPGGGEGDRSELGACKAVGIRVELRDGFGDPLAERRQDVRKRYLSR